MTKVVADITMSLDGFVTGPDPGIDNGLGTDGEALHTWVMEPDDVDTDVLATATARSGAVIMGRNLFDVIDGPHGWSDDMGYGAGNAGRPPFFVLTHQAPDAVRLDLDFTFVTEGGMAAAVDQARASAGDKDVVCMGGGDVVRQCVDEGHADELVLHLSPLLLGAGTPLFVESPRRQLVQRTVRPSTNATHLTYDVV